MTVVDFWFDPSCPYTWLTSRWIREVERVREVEVRWRVMSLSVLNEHLDEDPEGDTEGYLWMPVRVCAAVAEEHGQRALGDFFTAFGTRVHTRSDWDWGKVLPEALAEAGLPRGSRTRRARSGTTRRCAPRTRRASAWSARRWARPSSR